MLPNIKKQLTSETLKNFKVPVRVSDDDPLFMGCGLKYLVISDIHLGHRRTTTQSIITNLDKMLDTATLSTIDILFLAGDVFDRLLTFGSQEAIASTNWVIGLLSRCIVTGVMVRILEGTTSHDYAQSTIFTTIANVMDDDRLDIRYVNTLSIEYMAKFDVNVLYVPDNWRTKAEDVWKDVQGVLETHGLEQVDIGIMHGGFEFQLPVIQADTHDSRNYQRIVKYALSAGHIHIPNQNGKILVQGSSDRLSHNEEHPKGCMRVGIHPNGVIYSFIENPNPKVYKTVTVTGKSLEEVYEILEQLPDYPADSYIRLRLNKTDPIAIAMRTLAERWPQYNWTSVDDKDGETMQDNIMAEIEYKANDAIFTITKDNIERVVMDMFQNDTTVDTKVLESIVLEHR